MKFSLVLGSAIVCILSGTFSSHTMAACKVTDDAGSEIHLSQPARRIISLAPDITETLFAIGAGDHVIGVMQGSDYPEAAKKIPVTGSYTGLDMEKIISLHPDLIVTWGKVFSRQLSTFKKMGIPVYSSEPRQLNDVTQTMQNLGCLTGQQQSADQEVKRYENRLAELTKRYSRKKNITVFFQIGSYSLITINHESWINQAMTLCGGKNVFAHATLAAPEVTWEAVVQANPQVIISDVINSDWTSRWAKWSVISAVKNKKLYSIHPDVIERASPRLLDGVEQMCEAIEQAR